MKAIEDNPFAPPKTVETANAEREIAPFDWCKTPAVSGLRLGAFFGVLLAAVYLLGIAIAFPDNPSVLFSLPFTMLIWGAVFALLGALSGLLVGLVAMLTRDSAWRSVPQFVSCATAPPLLFVGPFVTIAYLGQAPISPTLVIMIAILLFCGMLMGVFLFRRLQSLAHAFSANRGALRRGGDVDERQ